MSDETRRDPSDLSGEDLSKGPTPRTRHPEGDLDDVEDTTQAPTPETRRAMRATNDDPAAAGQPATDPKTRADRGGDQDTGVARETRGDLEGADALTRSEEEPRVGTRPVDAGTARLVKTVETDHVEETVPVGHEEAVITSEPIAPGDASGAAIGEQTVTVELSEEVVDVDKRVVPKERVHLDKEVHTDEQTIEADLRKERVEVEGDADVRERR